MPDNAFNYNSTHGLHPNYRWHEAIMYMEVVSNAELLVMLDHPDVVGPCLCVFLKARNTWLAPIFVPKPYNRIYLVDILEDNTLLVLSATKLFYFQFSARFDSVTVQPFAELPQALHYIEPSVTRIGKNRWMLLLGTFEEKHLYEVTTEEVALRGMFSLDLIALCHLYNGNLFAYGRDASAGQRPHYYCSLYRYNIEKNLLLKILSFTGTSFMRNEPLMDCFFIANRFCAGVHSRSGVRSFHIFDLDKFVWLSEPVKLRNDRHAMRLLKSGEALLKDRTNSNNSILSVYFEPPSLEELALRSVHAAMPKETAEKLRETSVTDSLQLLHFLYEDECWLKRIFDGIKMLSEMMCKSRSTQSIK